MASLKQQAGWTKFGLLGVIISAFIGALAFFCILSLLPQGVIIAAPWLLITLFLLPLTYCYQVMTKVTEIKERSHKFNVLKIQ